MLEKRQQRVTTATMMTTKTSQRKTLHLMLTTNVFSIWLRLLFPDSIRIRLWELKAMLVMVAVVPRVVKGELHDSMACISQW